MQVYLAGAMRGQDAHVVKQSFLLGAAKLWRMGFQVFSPFEHDVQNGFEYAGTVTAEQAFVRSALAVDTNWICHHADAVALLPGWETSKGARAERALAEAIEIEVWEPFDWWYDEPDVAGGDIIRGGDAVVRVDPGDAMNKELVLRNQRWDALTERYATHD